MPPIIRFIAENVGWDAARWVYDLAGGGSAVMSAIFYSVMAAICAAVIAFRKAPLAVDRLQNAITAATAWFLVVLWAAIGIGILNKSDNFDFALVWQGVTLRGQKGIQIGLQFSNYGPSAIKYEVTDFSVVIGDTTIPNPKFENLGSVIPKGGSRYFYYPKFEESKIFNYLNKEEDGSISFTVNYGPYGGIPKRTLKMKLNSRFLISDNGSSVAYTISSESETQFKGE